MTLQEVIDWCEANNIPTETPLVIGTEDEDEVKDVIQVIHNGLDLILFHGGLQ